MQGSSVGLHSFVMENHGFFTLAISKASKLQQHEEAQSLLKNMIAESTLVDGLLDEVIETSTVRAIEQNQRQAHQEACNEVLDDLLDFFHAEKQPGNANYTFSGV